MKLPPSELTRTRLGVVPLYRTSGVKRLNKLGETGFMRKVISLAVLACVACVSAAQSGWKQITSIQGTVREHAAGRPERLLSLLQGPEGVRLETDKSVGGDLGGMKRIEVLSKAGVFTWLADRPQRALQLIIPTELDWNEFVARPRFSRADLEFNLKGIERALNKRVLVGKAEKVAGRDCLVLNVLDRPDSLNSDFQRLWVDRETGITLKLQDYFAGKLTYEREFLNIAYNVSCSQADFIPGSQTLIVRGPVAARTLLTLDQLKGPQQLKSDIEGINAKAKNPAQPWAGVAEVTNPFGYAQTTYREISPLRVAGGQTQSGQTRGNQFGNRDIQFLSGEGGAPVAVTATVVPSGEVRREVQIVVRADGQGELGRREFFIVSDENGNLLTFGDPGQEAGGATGSGTGSANPGPSLFAKSDFVNPKTGDTMTLVQVRGLPAIGGLGPIAFKSSEEIKDSKLTGAKVHYCDTPFKLTALTWKRGNVYFALASTTLDVKQLVKFAEGLNVPEQNPN